MNNYHVIYSDDPYLLARMCTELQMEGYLSEDSLFTEFRNPFNGRENLHIQKEKIFFYNHSCCRQTPEKNRHTLTKSNYLTVLKAVLNYENV